MTCSLQYMIGSQRDSTPLTSKTRRPYWPSCKARLAGLCYLRRRVSCPLAAAHIGQGTEALATESGARAETVPHPVILMARAWGLAPAPEYASILELE